jgi:hypothetical protein
MAIQTTRRILLYSIQAFQAGVPVADYRAIFTQIAEMSVGERSQRLKGNRVVVLKHVSVVGSNVQAVVYEGDVAAPIHLYDLKDENERFAASSKTEFVVHSSHVVINPSKKIVAIEYSHRGAKAEQISDLFEYVGLKLNNPTSIVLTPRASPTFLAEIAKFDRIRKVTVVLSQPNPDWTDQYNALTKLGKDSAAKDIAITASAHRGEGLSKQKGVVPNLISMLRSGQVPIRHAIVEGARPQSVANVSISMKDDVEKKIVSIPTMKDGKPDTNELLRQMGILVD